MNLFDFIPHDGSEITLDELSKKLGGANKELLGAYSVPSQLNTCILMKTRTYSSRLRQHASVRADGGRIIQAKHALARLSY